MTSKVWGVNLYIWNNTPILLSGLDHTLRGTTLIGLKYLAWEIWTHNFQQPKHWHHINYSILSWWQIKKRIHNVYEVKHFYLLSSIMILMLQWIHYSISWDCKFLLLDCFIQILLWEKFLFKWWALFFFNQYFLFFPWKSISDRDDLKILFLFILDSSVHPLFHFMGYAVERSIRMMHWEKLASFSFCF